MDRRPDRDRARVPRGRLPAREAGALGERPLGAWLVVAPLLLDYGAAAAANSVAVGAIVIALSLLRGKVPEDRFGGGWPSLWHDGDAAP